MSEHLESEAVLSLVMQIKEQKSRADAAEATLAALRREVEATDNLVRRAATEEAKHIIVLGYAGIRKLLSKPT